MDFFKQSLLQLGLDAGNAEGSQEIQPYKACHSHLADTRTRVSGCRFGRE